jgi:hypothetical protein
MTRMNWSRLRGESRVRRSGSVQIRSPKGRLAPKRSKKSKALRKCPMCGSMISERGFARHARKACSYMKKIRRGVMKRRWN